MNRFVRRLQFVVLVATLGARYLVAVSPAGIPAFSSDLVVTSEESSEPATWKLYSDGQKFRLDMPNEAETVDVIADPATRSSYLLMPVRNMYIKGEIENMAGGSILGQIKQLSPDNPCANRSGITCTRTGSETIGGRICDQWKYEGSLRIQTICLDRKLHLPLKVVNGDGAGFSLQNLREGPQDASLFTIPKDYRPFETSAMRDGFLGNLSYSFFLYGPFSWILRVICIVHWFRRRPYGYWLWIIMIGGTVGALAYVVIEMIPDVTLLRNAFASVGRNRRIRELNLTVQDNPAPGNYEELGDLYLDAKKYAEACTAYDRAITPRTDYASPFYRRALARMELKDYAAAEPDLKRVYAIDQKHDFQRAAGLLAYVLWKNGKTEEAANIFAAVTRTSTISETLYNYAEFLNAQGNAPEARACLQRVLNKKATLPVFLKRRERPWFRKARTLLKAIPQTAA